MTKKQLEKYKEQYILLAEVAPLLGVSLMLLQIYKKNIPGFPAVSLDYCSRNFYDRTEMLAYIAANKGTIEAQIDAIRDGKKNSPVIEIATAIKPRQFITGVFDRASKKRLSERRLNKARKQQPITQKVRVIGDYL